MADQSEDSEATAGPQLAAIPELVEEILLHLPLHEILLAQRVDRTWHGIIKGSPKLQKAPVVRSIFNEPLQLMDVENYTDPCDCPSIMTLPPARHVLPWTLPDSGERKAIRYTFETSNEWKPLHVPHLNPFLLEMEYYGEYVDREDFEDFIESAGPNSSLMDMLITQPGVKEFIVNMDAPWTWIRHVISCKPGAKGVTVGDVFRDAKPSGSIAHPSICLWRVDQYWCSNAYMSGAEWLQELEDSNEDSDKDDDEDEEEEEEQEKEE